MQQILSSAAILLDLFIMLAAAKLMAEIFERLKQPAVVGEILAGVVIGPSFLGWVVPSDIINILAEFGVIFLLFNVGLETKPQSIFQVASEPLWSASLGVILPFVAGYFIAIAWGGSLPRQCLSGPHSLPHRSASLRECLGAMGLLDAPTARIILGAAVIDDILGLIILSLVSAVSQGALVILALQRLRRQQFYSRFL